MHRCIVAVDVLAFGILIASLGAASQPSQASAGDLDCSLTVGDGQRAEATALFQQGQQALLASRWSEAEAPLLRAVTLDPLQALAHYGLGQAYIGLARYPDAVRAFSLCRTAFRCGASAAGREDQMRRVDEAIRALRDMIRNFEQRRAKESAVQWKEVNRDTTTPGDGLRAQLELERRLEDLERWRKSGDAAPLGVTLALGTALFQAGALADAEREFRAVLAADPRLSDAHNNLAVVCMLTDRLEEAEREIALAQKAGVEVNPRLRDELRKRKQSAATERRPPP